MDLEPKKKAESDLVSSSAKSSSSDRLLSKSRSETGIAVESATRSSSAIEQNTNLNSANTNQMAEMNEKKVESELVTEIKKILIKM